MNPGQASWLAGAAAAVAAICIGGVVAAWAGWWPAARSGRAARRSRLEQLPPAWRAAYRPMLGGSVVAGVGLWAWTGWPVVGLAAVVAVAGLPFVLHPGGSPTRRVEMIEGLAEWMLHVASIHVSGLALEGTLRASAGSVPEAVQEPVQEMIRRLESGWDPEDAYRALADRLDDGVVDGMVMLLLTHARERGPGLSATLQGMAEMLQREAVACREVEAERAKQRTAARGITAISVALPAMVIVMMREYSAPYGTVQGQVVLALVVGAFALLLGQLSRMAKAVPAPRMLHRREVDTGREAMRR